jgi:N-acetylglucosamine kinase-like BadF-type ATPase
MSEYVLGVDGGGTKTHVAVVDGGGRVCGTGVSGPSNYDDVGVEVAQANIEQAVQAARHSAGLDETRFAAVFLGMAGVVSPQDRAAIRGIAERLKLAPPERIGIDHDCRIALAGGLSGRPGIVQIAGTGSSCYGRNAAGEDWRSGGWGHLISDEGSGYWLGIQAMRLAAGAFDGRVQPTPLLEAVQQRLDLEHMNDIMHHLYVKEMSRAEIATLAPLVIEAAQAGDAVSLASIRQGTQELADCVLAVAKRLGLAGGPCELALVGGLFQAGDIYVQPFKEAVSERLPGCRVTHAELPPVLGACLLALEMLGVRLDDAAVAALCHHADR